MEPELLDAALWQASRDGMHGQLLDPATRTLEPALAVVVSLLRHVSDALEQAGDLPRVTALLERLGQTGTGARRQQHAFQTGGLPGLRGLLATSFTQAAIPGG